MARLSMELTRREKIVVYVACFLSSSAWSIITFTAFPN